MSEEMSEREALEILGKYMTEDDLYDMDAGLTDDIPSSFRLSGISMMPAGESVARMIEPLTEDMKLHFGDICLRALRHAEQSGVDLHLDRDRR